MPATLAPATTQDIVVRVEHAPEEHTLYIIESSTPLSEPQLGFLSRRYVARRWPNEHGYYRSSDPALRPHVAVFLAVGDSKTCKDLARPLRLNLESMANHPAHT